jgi:hypothetical protein
VNYTPKGLKRIASVYKLVEQIRSLELKMAADRALEVERAERMAADSLELQESFARTGLIIGDREQWAAGEVMRSASAARLQSLREVRRQREGVRIAAETAYRLSRVESSQVETAAARSAAVEELDRARRAQQAADDRFLSRREWMRLHEVEDPSRP